jgi:hypothetical protein
MSNLREVLEQIDRICQIEELVRSLDLTMLKAAVAGNIDKPHPILSNTDRDKQIARFSILLFYADQLAAIKGDRRPTTKIDQEQDHDHEQEAAGR